MMEEVVHTTTSHTASTDKHISKLYAKELRFVNRKIVIETVFGATAYSYLVHWRV
jgi:hypothetical protein